MAAGARGGAEERCPNRPVGAVMDLSQPPPGGAAQAFAGDKRTSPRYAYHRKTLCQPYPSGEGRVASGETAGPASSPLATRHSPLIPDPSDNVWLMGVSQDLSATGLGFILHRRFDPGTLLTIELERPKRDTRGGEPPAATESPGRPGPTWGVLPARVVHATPQPDGNWKLGCALVKAMSPEELHSWINGNEAAARP